MLASQRAAFALQKVVYRGVDGRDVALTFRIRRIVQHPKIEQFGPSLKGNGAFTASPSDRQTCDANRFVEIGPFIGVSVSQQASVAEFLLGRLLKSWIPFPGEPRAICHRRARPGVCLGQPTHLLPTARDQASKYSCHASTRNSRCSLTNLSILFTSCWAKPRLLASSIGDSQSLATCRSRLTWMWTGSRSRYRRGVATRRQRLVP